MNLGIETETLEFKKSTGELKEAMNSISAILNKHQQGEIYFGVKPDGTVIGQVVTEESLREVSQKIKNSIEPKIYPEVKKVVMDVNVNIKMYKKWKIKMYIYPCYASAS